MPTEKNVKIVADLTEGFKGSSLVIAANYRGLDVGEMQGMRKAIRETNSSFQVAKNTLARIAADDAGRPELKEIIDGPIGFLTTEGDPAAAAKVFVKYIDDNSIAMTIVGGALDAEVLATDRIKALAKLPPKEELLAKMLGSMNSPITGLVMVMTGTIKAFAIVLQRISEQGETATESEDASPTAEAGEAPEAEAETETAPAAEVDATSAESAGEDEKPSE